MYKIGVIFHLKKCIIILILTVTARRQFYTMAYVLSKVLSSYVSDQIQDYTDYEQKMSSKQYMTKYLFSTVMMQLKSYSYDLVHPLQTASSKILERISMEGVYEDYLDEISENMYN